MKELIRPYMAAIGYTAAIIITIVAFLNQIISFPQAIAVCLAPAISWFGLRQKEKVDAKKPS